MFVEGREIILFGGMSESIFVLK